MSGDRESILSRILVPVIVAVFIALLAGGTAPWWLSVIFPPPPSPTPTATTFPTAGPTPSLTAGPTGPTAGPQTGCVLTITNPFVSLHESPDIASTEIGDVPRGTYAATDSTVVDFAGQSQRWFQITAVGRTGWVLYNTILIESKSAECP
jgi:hypothetical protein